MSVLLRNIEGDEWDVLYANLLAMQCFAGELNQKATDFFGDDWSTIEEGLSNSHNQSEYTTELFINKDGVKTLVEMTVQQRLETGEYKFIFIELRERLILTDTTAHDEQTEKLLYLSYHDQLTGLWNRRAMKEHFSEDSTYALKSNERLSFIHLGLDRFKLINESIGHNGADEILKMVAERLKIICPESARLYRNGGDEFIVSLQNHSVSKTESFARKLLSDFGKPFYFNHQEYFISASIGISVYPEDGKTLEI